MISLLVSMRAIPPIITNDLIILFNRDNFFYVHTSIDLTLNILKFLNENENIYNCCVCLNDCFNVTTCRHCPFKYAFLSRGVFVVCCCLLLSVIFFLLFLFIICFSFPSIS